TPFGAREAIVSVNPVSASFTSMFSSVTLPVLVTVIVYSSTSPTALYAVVAALPLIDVSAFTSVKAGFCVPGVSTSPSVGSSGSIGLPSGSSPAAVAVFSTLPLSRSFWVMVYVVVKVSTPFGARVVIVSVRPVSGSLTAMFSSVTLPVLVTVMVYSSTSPTALYAVVAASPLIDVSAFTSVKAGVCVPGVSTSPSVGSSGSTGSPSGSSPVAVAVFSTLPLSRSAWVMVYVVVRVRSEERRVVKTGWSRPLRCSLTSMISSGAVHGLVTRPTHSR